MNRIYIPTTILLFFSINSYCQIIWCPSGATWHNYYSSIGGYVGYVETKYVADTAVAGMNCKKLVEHQRYKFYNGGNTIDSFKTLFSYESGGVIFMFNLIQGSNNWDTLYNFNTPVNSKWHLNSMDTVFIKVYGAGTEIINGDTLQWRTINFVSPQDSSFSHDTLFERIGLTGNDFGFINPQANYDLVEPSIHGLCNYQDDSFPIYGNTDSTCAHLPTGITDLNGIEMSISVYPNPVSEQLTFELSNHEVTTVILYDIFSQQVLQQTFTNLTTIKTEQLQDGIYFYELRIGKTIIKNGKVIKQ